ncbi:MAG: transketolase [Elusimicrobia bacterium]|nr:transketolase [Elusimicrobiota bacterium]
MRTAFFKTLEDLAEKDPRITFITGDLGFSVVETYARRFPKQFLNAGVAEANMTGVAVGLALSGKIVFTYSIGNFPTLRCLEQIRNDACYHRANVNVVSVGGGLSYGALGSSHHATEDLAIFRVLPEMTVVAPSDPVESALATRAIVQHPGPCFLRLGKAGEPTLHDPAVSFTLGKSIRIRDGADVTLIGTGPIVATCLQAADRLAEKGLSTRVISMHTLKPLDREAILMAAQETSAILTVEEHSEIGGLGGAVAEVLAQSDGPRVPFRIVGLPDRFCRVVGNHDYLKQISGLTVQDIVREAGRLIGQKV